MLKVAIVKPLHKGGNKQDPSNYRPIAILPIAGKIFEYVMVDRWHEHLLNNNIVNDSQFGFVDASNTETATVHLLSSVYNSIEKKAFTATLFIDISKAFDCVDHELFIEKLKHLKLSDNYFNLLSSYFRNRSQCVDLNGLKAHF